MHKSAETQTSKNYTWYIVFEESRCAVVWRLFSQQERLSLVAAAAAASLLLLQYDCWYDTRMTLSFIVLQVKLDLFG